MSKNTKNIDVLFEDPPLSGQKYALVSIVGPHMPQKCDVWGLKIRGVSESLEKAKALTQRLMRMDVNYDIYTVEVGKFFPLAVEPHDIGNVEYQNSQLNDLVKGYLENRELANEHWHARKNELIKEAVKEGKNQEEFANRPEHPVAVLDRIKKFEDSLKELKENMESIEHDLHLSKDKFSKYTEEERTLAAQELSSAINNVSSELKSNDSELSSMESIRTKMMEDLNDQYQSHSLEPQQNTEVAKTLQEIKSLEDELDELKAFKSSIDDKTSPHVYSRTCKNIETCSEKIATLKETLNNANLVNSYINSSYSTSKYDHLDSPDPAPYSNTN